jgi:hypothetical protein
LIAHIGTYPMYAPPAIKSPALPPAVVVTGVNVIGCPGTRR